MGYYCPEFNCMVDEKECPFCGENHSEASQ